MKWHFPCIVGLVCLSCVLFLSQPSVGSDAEERDQGVLSVLYLEFPPYYFTNPHGQADGILLNLARDIFREAGIGTRYASMPAKRVLENFRKAGDSDRFASVGWFKTPERMGFARFSRPIYQNRPLVILFLEKHRALFEKYETFEQLTADGTLTLGLLDGYSYHTALDTMIRRSSTRKRVVVGEFPQLVRMLAAERFFYIIVAPEEVDRLIEASGLPKGRFMSKAMRDIPTGNKRYVMFSKGVPDSLIERVNMAIGRVVGEKSE
ncbi:transporter substrate-binding domain-containing protein [Pseudodesulfovibrio cashew]|uniref:Transporter substrate-binding domain-containing protein n=1 Tax=Pseudodesulfovibrio cashew TaxID=2678688 RepID=A0A6I6JNG9_9BACT|nr:transporter substrate-binding domain-containing protein [Pseudodesulfovibrio cashew]QGY41633.1 transporter substrate-binding domain-containing protein [Pseudodesulfovibrio cashew]